MLNHRSEQLNELFSAIAKAQAEFSVAGHNAENPHFRSKFSDISELVRVSRPMLTKNGLSVIHQILPDASGEHYMHTILAHASGQYIETRIGIKPAKSDIQALGGCITYLKRYTYAAIIGLVSSAEDDDGESQMNRGAPNQVVNSTLPKNGVSEVISNDQLMMLENELKDDPQMVQTIIEKMNIGSLKQLPKHHFMNTMQRIGEIKRVREGR